MRDAGEENKFLRPDSPEDRLVERAVQGDRDAFERLVRTWWARMGSYCAAATGFDPVLADETAQDALFRLYTALPRFRGESSFGTFVYRICRNAALDLMRRRRRESQRMIQFPVASEEEGEGPVRELADLAIPGPEEAFLRRESADELTRVLQELDPDDRALLYLRDSEGMSVTQLSGIFGIPEGTVKSRLSRLRAKVLSGMTALSENHVSGKH